MCTNSEIYTYFLCVPNLFETDNWKIKSLTSASETRWRVFDKQMRRTLPSLWDRLRGSLRYAWTSWPPSTAWWTKCKAPSTCWTLRWGASKIPLFRQPSCNLLGRLKLTVKKKIFFSFTVIARHLLYARVTLPVGFITGLDNVLERWKTFFHRRAYRTQHQN